MRLDHGRYDVTPLPSSVGANAIAPDDGDELKKKRIGSRDLHVDTQANTTSSDIDDVEQDKPTSQPVSWSELPRKDQLFVLMLARLSEPLTQTSLGAYLYYQLQSFDPSLPESTISYQAGIIGAAFPATQFMTAMLWGRFSDAEYGGRKRTIYLGLLGTMLSIIGFGFSRSFAMAVAFRCLGGILNGNVGVMRTMISEIIKEKKYQSRAFLILPMIFNVGVLVGPIMGEYHWAVYIEERTDNNRWCASRSLRQLPFSIRAQLHFRWQRRRTVDEAIPLRPTQSHERRVPMSIIFCRSLLP